MSRAAARFTQADIARATRGARKAGAGYIEVLKDGTIRIHLDEAPKVSPDSDDPNPWDDE